jgi:hypothetical protein
MHEGKFTVRAKDFKFGTAKTGTDYLGILLEVTEGECKGEVIGAQLYFTENTVERNMESLRHLGWDGKDITKLTGLGATNAKAEADIGWEERDVPKPGGRPGETVRTRELRVKWINQLGRILISAEMDPAAKMSFADRVKAMADTARANRAGGGGSRPSVPSGGGAGDDFGGGGGDDDIPF